MAQVSSLREMYHFTCLPFGLSSAPWVFTKTLKPILALLRGMGMRLVAYIDDILILGGVQGDSPRSCGRYGVPAGMSGLCNQQREISTCSEPDHRVSGSNGRHSQHGATTSTSQNKNDSGGVSEIVERRSHLSSRLSAPVGEELSISWKNCLQPDF